MRAATPTQRNADADAARPALRDPLLTRREAAGLLRISEQTLANWLSAYGGRGLAYVKLGKRVMYPLSGVQAFVDRNTFNANAASEAAGRNGQ